jgi:DNA-binding transcriptional regulator PaaX
MSYRLMADVLARSRAPLIARFVLVALAERANKHGICWCGIADLCDRTGASERTVRNALPILERLGELRIERRPGRTHRYRITPPAAPRPRTTSGNGLDSTTPPRQEMPGYSAS